MDMKRLNLSALIIITGMTALMSLIYLNGEPFWFQLTIFYLVFQLVVFRLELYMKRPTYKWLVFVSLWIVTASTFTIHFLIGEWLAQSFAFLSMSLVNIGLLRIYTDIENSGTEHFRAIYQWMLIALLPPILVYSILEVVNTTGMGGWTVAGFLVLIALVAKGVSYIEDDEPGFDRFENFTYLAALLYFMFLVSNPNFWTGTIALGALAGYILLMVNEQTNQQEKSIDESVTLDTVDPDDQ